MTTFLFCVFVFELERDTSTSHCAPEPSDGFGKGGRPTGRAADELPSPPLSLCGYCLQHTREREAREPRRKGCLFFFSIPLFFPFFYYDEDDDTQWLKYQRDWWWHNRPCRLSAKHQRAPSAGVRSVDKLYKLIGGAEMPPGRVHRIKFFLSK